MKTVVHSWGHEYILGSGERVVRVYASAKKVTIDLSQVRDLTWSVLQRVQAKHGQTTKIVLPSGTPTAPILEWFEAQY
jgi:hypothetical protein